MQLILCSLATVFHHYCNDVNFSLLQQKEEGDNRAEKLEGGEGEGGGEEREGEERESGRGGEGEHAYLLLSRSDSTMVLRTGQEIAELDSSGFATQAPTVYAGNLGGGNYIVQVCCYMDLVACVLHEALSPLSYFLLLPSTQVCGLFNSHGPLIVCICIQMQHKPDSYWKNF